jgi:uncharacterized integral membrane protein (TIGR00697 family)
MEHNEHKTLTMDKDAKTFMIMSVLFSVCLLTSNLLATKAIQIFGITATAGLFIFPISYILNDCIVEVWGYSKMKMVIWTGLGANILLIVCSQIAIHLPAAPWWIVHEEGFNFVFGLAPRIVLGSLCAFAGGSLINAAIMHHMKRKHGDARFSLRAMLSTLAGEALDSAIFFPIAFGGIMPWSVILIMVISQTFMKSAGEAIILPITVRVVKGLKKVSL